jgi:hypothetical protein
MDTADARYSSCCVTVFVSKVLLSLALPMLSYVHPRIASEFDGPDTRKVLEPPGFLGLHYGYRTPLVLLIAQTSYGVILGFGFASFFE